MISPRQTSTTHRQSLLGTIIATKLPLECDELHIFIKNFFRRDSYWGY